MVTKDLGMVTAYAYAVAGGYTGTEAEFTQLMADLAVVVDDFDNFSVNVTTLPAGSSATASYADGVLSLGIPKGDTGATGATGETGAPAGFGTVSATVDDNIGTPSVEVTASGADTAKNFAFAFHNLKGEKGDKGDTGEVSEAELTQAFEDFSENGTVANAEQLTTDIKANDQSPYLFRTSGGSVDIGDREYINGIVGGTIAWNQLVNNGNFAENSGWIAGNNASLVIANNKATITKSGATGEVVSLTKDASNRSLSISGHKYLIITQITSANKVGIVPTGTTGDGWSGYSNAGDYTTKKTLALIWGCAVNKPMLFDIRSYQGSGVSTDINTVVENLVCFDLTQMFGSTIADYIYSLEQSNAGAGVAWFKKYFPKPYYAYNAGELMSVKALRHKTVGFNAWDGVQEQGIYDVSTGLPVANTSNYRNKNFIPVLPNTKYCYSNENAAAGIRLCYYDADKNFITSRSNGNNNPQTFITPENAHYVTFYWSDISKVCINLSWDGERDGEYEEYSEHIYELDPDLELRGIPKLSAGNDLYYDGDVYESDGTVTRKYGVVDLGTLGWVYEPSSTRFYSSVFDNAMKSAQLKTTLLCTRYTENGSPVTGTNVDKTMWLYSNLRLYINDFAYTDAATFKNAMSGVYLVYELETPTTEEADSYNGTQIVDDFGTEEFVLSDSVFPVPVGHNTDYPINLKAKVEMMPNSPSGDGDYIVRQTNGVNEYVSIANNATIQNILSRLEALEG